MRRNNRGSMAYWDKWIAFEESSILDPWEKLKSPSGNPSYRPQYVFELAKKHYELMLFRYSRGDEVTDLAQHFEGLLDAWEESERLGKDVWSEQIQYTRHAWEVNLDHYIRCFWLTGLALTLNIPEHQWLRLLSLMGNEGEDALLDRVIAYRHPKRKIGNKLCFPKAYQPLLATFEAPAEQRPHMLRAFLEKWFVSLKNAGSPTFPSDFRTPYWWDFCANQELGMKGAYFGCWCIEAVAVAKVFEIDDSLCLDHPHYPGDLLRDGRCPRYADNSAPSPTTSAVSATDQAAPSKVPRQGLLSKLLKRLR